MGVDGGGLDDLLGVGVVGRDRITRKWLSWGHAFAHVSVLERRKSEASKLRDFAEHGDLTIVDRMSIAFESVADIAEEVEQGGNLASVGLDPYGVAEIVEAMALRNISGDDRIVGVSQGYKADRHDQDGGSQTGRRQPCPLRIGDDGLVRQQREG